MGTQKKCRDVNDTHHHWPVVEQGFQEGGQMNPESRNKCAIFTRADR
jgi:hypothetical protein